MYESEFRLGSIEYKKKYISELENDCWNECDFLNNALLCGCDVSRSKLSKWDLKRVERYSGK